MNNLRRIALAACLPVTLLAVAGQAASAAAPPTEPPAVQIPADFVPLTDDTGTISVMVPGSWVDVDTAPSGSVPFIEAAVDRQTYNDTFETAGMTFIAIPFAADTATAVRDFGLTGGCATESTEPYDDGAFVGTHLIYTDCETEGSGIEFHVIAANPANQAFTAMLRIQITSEAERPILDGILATFNMTAPAGTPGSSVPAPGSSLPVATIPAVVVPTTAAVVAPTTAAGGLTPATAPTVPAGVFPPPTGEVPAGWTQIVDDSGTIGISVPATWTAIHTTAANDGTPWISATTDDAQFFPAEGQPDTFAVPGVIFNAVAFNADTAGALEAASYAGVCTDDGAQTYSDGVFTGHIQSFSNCGGTASRVVQIAANPADGAFTAFLLIQLTGAADDATTLNGLLLSFNSVAG